MEMSSKGNKLVKAKLKSGGLEDSTSAAERIRHQPGRRLRVDVSENDNIALGEVHPG